MVLTCPYCSHSTRASAANNTVLICDKKQPAQHRFSIVSPNDTCPAFKIARSSAPPASSAPREMLIPLTQGLFAKLVADTSAAELRGTAFGIYNLVSGGALLLASVLAGALWQAFGAPATFAAGAAFAGLAALGLLLGPAVLRALGKGPGR